MQELRWHFFRISCSTDFDTTVITKSSKELGRVTCRQIDARSAYIETVFNAFHYVWFAFFTFYYSCIGHTQKCAAFKILQIQLRAFTWWWLATSHPLADTHHLLPLTSLHSALSVSMTSTSWPKLRAICNLSCSTFPRRARMLISQIQTNTTAGSYFALNYVYKNSNQAGHIFYMSYSHTLSMWCFILHFLWKTNPRCRFHKIQRGTL